MIWLNTVPFFVSQNTINEGERGGGRERERFEILIGNDLVEYSAFGLKRKGERGGREREERQTMREGEGGSEERTRGGEGERRGERERQRMREGERRENEGERRGERERDRGENIIEILIGKLKLQQL